jgi:Ca2+/Na+ antiporter
MEQLRPLSATLLAFWLAFLFYVLVTVTSKHFLPALSRFTESIRLSTSLAGVTFLALANGVPHVIGAGVAIGYGSPSLGIGALLGAGLFVCTVVWAAVTWENRVIGELLLGASSSDAAAASSSSSSSSRRVHAPMFRRPLYRDLSFLLLAIVGTFFLVFFERVALWTPFVFLTSYALYVLVVLGGRFIHQRRVRMRREALGIVDFLMDDDGQEDDQEDDDDDGDELAMPTAVTDDREPLMQELGAVAALRPKAQRETAADADYPMLDEILFISNMQSFGSSTRQVDEHTDAMLQRNEAALLDSSRDTFFDDDDEPKRKRRSNAKKSYRKINVDGDQENCVHAIDSDDDDELNDKNVGSRNALARVAWQFWRDFVATVVDALGEVRWREKNFPQRLWFCVTLPAMFARNATIPMMSDRSWRRLWALLNPVCAPLVVLLATHHFTAPMGGVFPVWALLVLIGSALSLLVLLTSSHRTPPRYYLVFIVASVFMSLVWMYLLACEVIDVVRLLARAADVDESTAGVTVFAWGNSVVDLMANTAVAHQGFRNMALSACLSTSTFAILFGVGFSLIVKVAIEGGVYYVHIDTVLTTAFAAFTALVLIVGAALPIMKFHVRKSYALFALAFYATFLLFVVLIEFNVFN